MSCLWRKPRGEEVRVASSQQLARNWSPHSCSLQTIEFFQWLHELGSDSFHSDGTQALASTLTAACRGPCCVTKQTPCILCLIIWPPKHSSVALLPQNLLNSSAWSPAGLIPQCCSCMQMRPGMAWGLNQGGLGFISPPISTVQTQMGYLIPSISAAAFVKWGNNCYPTELL